MNTFSTFSKKLSALKESAKEEFLKTLKEVFQLYPEIKTIKWTQFTPFFNDGDTCEFDIHGVYVSTVSSEHIGSYGEFVEDYEEKEGDFLEDFSYIDKDLMKKYPVICDLVKFMNSELGLEVCKFAFGDHVEVIATPKGIETEEHEHD